jgi:hypothetical protein
MLLCHVIRSCSLAAVVTCTIWASVAASGRHPCSTAQMQAYRLPGGPPWYGALRATPSLPTQTGPAPPREDATRTSGRESRGSAGSPRRRRAARRARAARAAARRGRLAGRRVGGRAGGRSARAARVELSSILGGLTARTRGTPAHLRQSFPPHPPLHLGWKAAPLMPLRSLSATISRQREAQLSAARLTTPEDHAT